MALLLQLEPAAQLAVVPYLQVGMAARLRYHAGSPLAAWAFGRSSQWRCFVDLLTARDWGRHSLPLEAAKQ